MSSPTLVFFAFDCVDAGLPGPTSDGACRFLPGDVCFVTVAAALDADKLCFAALKFSAHPSSAQLQAAGRDVAQTIHWLLKHQTITYERPLWSLMISTVMHASVASNHSLRRTVLLGARLKVLLDFCDGGAAASTKRLPEKKKPSFSTRADNDIVMGRGADQQCGLRHVDAERCEGHCSDNPTKHK